MKSTDLLFTTPTVLQWCKEKDGGLEFDLAGCMLFLLFVRAGSGFYPEYDASEIPDLMDVQRYVCGWNEGYAQVPTKYSRTLKQRSPVLPTPNRGAKLPTGSCLFYGDSVNMGDHVQTLKSRKRRRSS